MGIVIVFLVGPESTVVVLRQQINVLENLVTNYVLDMENVLAIAAFAIKILQVLDYLLENFVKSSLENLNLAQLLGGQSFTFFDGRYPSRQKKAQFLYLAVAKTFHNGTAPIRFLFINAKEKSNKFSLLIKFSNCLNKALKYPLRHLFKCKTFLYVLMEIFSSIK